jgi:class 3 adenylate cyclase
VRDAEVRFAEHAGDYLAFSIFGEGPHDVVITQGFFPIDLMWELPQLAAFMEELGRFARVIVFDHRDVGASDRTNDPNASRGELLSDDLLAVLDAADSDSATLFGMGPGSGESVLFAATYPERTRSLILVSFRTHFPEFANASPEQLKRIAINMRSPEWLRRRNPRVAHDPVLQRWWGRATRLANTPGGTVWAMTIAANINYEPVLPLVRVPTLVLHRRDNRLWDMETSRDSASRIPGARFVELPGAENDIFLGDTKSVLAEIEQFLNEPETPAVHDRPLATVLFTDIVSSTEQLAARGDEAWHRLLDDHDATMSRIVSDHRGQLVRMTGDGILATFDGVARAVRCAAALLDAANRQGIPLRAGLHAGEIEVRPNDIAGIAVHIASRISTLAGPNEILVSRTVVDLTAGSGLEFEAQGEHQLKGVPGTWPIFSAHAAVPDAAP